MIVVLAVLALFAGLGVVVPVGDIGKVPKTLTGDVAAFAVAVMVAALIAMFSVVVHLDGAVAVHTAEGFVMGSWVVRLFRLVSHVGKVSTQKVQAGQVTLHVAWNLAVLAVLLYLLTQAV